MSDELRQAAETIIGCTTRMENKFGVQYERDESKFCFGLKEPYELAHAYLREHDPTPIDADWLRSVGFKNFDNLGSGCHASSDDFTVACGYRGQWLVNGAELEKWPETRGDVRRLCAALGVPLEET